MANETAKVKAEKKVTISDLKAETDQIFGLNEDGTPTEATTKLRDAIAKGLVKAEIKEVVVEEGKYSGDFVKLTLGENAKDEASILAAMVAIAGGNLTQPLKEAEEGKEPEEDQREPSVVKFFTYGADLASRSRVSQAIKRAVAGPEKTIERMAAMLAAQKNIPLAQAKEMVQALMS